MEKATKDMGKTAADVEDLFATDSAPMPIVVPAPTVVPVVVATTTAPPKEKEPKATSPKAEEPYTPIITTRGSFHFEHRPDDGGDKCPAKVFIAVDAGSSIVKAKGGIVYKNTTVTIDYPPTHDGMPSEFLEVVFHKIPEFDLFEESPLKDARYMEVAGEHCSFRFNKLPSGSAKDTLGIRMPKATTCQSRLSDSNNWAPYNNKVFVEDKKHGTSYDYTNLGEIPDCFVTGEKTGKKNYAIISSNVMTSKIIATIAAEVLAKLAKRVSETLGVGATADQMFREGIELFIVCPMPIGTPISMFNDRPDLPDEISDELARTRFEQNPETLEVETRTAGDSGITAKIAVRYTTCHETVHGMTRCLSSFPDVARLCAAFDLGHSTAQGLVFEASEKNAVVKTTNSATKSYGGLYFIQRTMMLYCKKTGVDFASLLWQGNDTEMATGNYKLMEKLLCDWESCQNADHYFLVQNGPLRRIKISLDAMGAAFDEIARELIGMAMEQLADGKYFDKTASPTRVLSLSGRLTMYKFRTGEAAGQNFAQVFSGMVRSRLAKDVPTAKFAPVDLTLVGSNNNIQDVAGAVATLANETPIGTLYTKNQFPVLHETIILAERLLTCYGKADDATEIRSSMLCSAANGREFVLSLTASEKDVPFTHVLLAIPVARKLGRKDIEKIYSKQLEEKILKSDKETAVALVPCAKIPLPSIAASEIQLRVRILGTFAVSVEFKFKIATGAECVVGPRLITLPVLDLAKVFSRSFFIDSREVSFSSYEASRAAGSGSGKTMSEIIEDHCACSVEMPGDPSPEKYIRNESRKNLVARPVNCVQPNVIVPMPMREKATFDVGIPVGKSSQMDLVEEERPKPVVSSKDSFAKRRTQKKTPVKKARKAKKDEEYEEDDEEEDDDYSAIAHLDFAKEEAKKKKKSAKKNSKKRKNVEAEDEDEAPKKKKHGKKKAKKEPKDDEEDEEKPKMTREEARKIAEAAAKAGFASKCPASVLEKAPKAPSKKPAGSGKGKGKRIRPLASDEERKAFIEDQEEEKKKSREFARKLLTAQVVSEEVGRATMGFEAADVFQAEEEEEEKEDAQVFNPNYAGPAPQPQTTVASQPDATGEPVEDLETLATAAMSGEQMQNMMMGIPPVSVITFTDH